MKAKLHLMVLWASMLGGTAVYGEDVKCPQPGTELPEGWVLSRKHPTPFSEATSFKNAWIYDKDGEPAKCHYKTEGKKMVSLENFSINTSTHHFKDVKRNKKHPGYHCKESIEACVFKDGSSEITK